MERNWKEIGDLSKMNSLDRLLDRIWFRDHNVPLFERKQARARQAAGAREASRSPRR